MQGLLVSGPNGSHGPDQFKRDLVDRSVPPQYITLDQSGGRTLDSVVRAKEVFGQSSMVVVSQRFHCERAMYLADRHGVDLVGFAARDVGGLPGLRARYRETLARVKAFLDLHILRTGPQTLSHPVTVKLRKL